jgi:hypothetical protein
MSVTSEAAAAEAVESLADTAEDLEIDVEAGESSSEEEEEEEGEKVLEPIAEGRVADPDPDWIRIQLGQCIRIRIPYPDPNPGGQK